MLSHVLPQYRLEGRMSDKVLFYAEDLHEGSAICLDDLSLFKQIQEVLIGVMSLFLKEFLYRTVDQGMRGITRVIFWVFLVDYKGGGCW